jgi:hypothetical protein
MPDPPQLCLAFREGEIIDALERHYCGQLMRHAHSNDQGAALRVFTISHGFHKWRQ